MTSSVRLAASKAELASHMDVREQVFVAEQQLFRVTDRDPWDDSALHAVAISDEHVIGAVRLYALDEAGLWKGDRLAVVPVARRTGAARDLVRFAVTTAAALGGTLMLAQVQTGNVRFFERLGWESMGALFEYRGVPHLRMSIGLGTPTENPGAWEAGAALSGR